MKRKWKVTEKAGDGEIDKMMGSDTDCLFMSCLQNLHEI